MKNETKNIKPTREYRKNLRLALLRTFDTQANAAFHLKIDEAVLSKIINAVRDPSEEQAKQLCNILEMLPEKLFEKFPREKRA